MKSFAKESTLDGIVERLKQAYHPERIYLFGSRARGDDGPDSDFDFLVVVPDDAPRERRGSRLAYQALRGTGVAADILVWTRAYFESRRHLKASLSSTVASEGRLLYAAANSRGSPIGLDTAQRTVAALVARLPAEALPTSPRDQLP
jgi:predicted nucleotidyltransferase